MIPELTRYLLLYKRVCIPGVGTFELVQQSPQLDVADHIFKAPTFTTQFRKDVSVPEHQSRFLASSLDKDSAGKDLVHFGEQLKASLRRKPFSWNGFGTLSFVSNEIVFEPRNIILTSLNPIKAEKVLRENVQHQVLVGDKEMTSQQVTDFFTRTIRRRPLYIIIGWVLLLLAVIAVIIMLYLGKFQPPASGLRLKTTSVLAIFTGTIF